MKSPEKIVNTLLDSKFDAKEFLQKTTQRLILAFPPELHDLIQTGNGYGPSEDFMRSMLTPMPEQIWQLNDPDELPVWPEYSDETDTWNFRIHFGCLAVRDQQLFVEVWEAEPDGDTFVHAAAAWGSPQHEALRKAYSHKAHIERSIVYTESVLYNGDDPLGWYGNDTQEAREALSILKTELRDAEKYKRLFIIP